MHTPHAQIHHYQSQAIRPEEKKKPQLIKPSRKYILTDASTSILPIPEVQRWRYGQAHPEEINQVNRPCFVQRDEPNKYPDIWAYPTISHSVLDSFVMLHVSTLNIHLIWSLCSDVTAFISIAQWTWAFGAAQKCHHYFNRWNICVGKCLKMFVQYLIPKTIEALNQCYHCVSQLKF